MLCFKFFINSIDPERENFINFATLTFRKRQDIDVFRRLRKSAFGRDDFIARRLAD